MLVYEGGDEVTSIEEALRAHREFWVKIERKETLKRRRESSHSLK